MDLVIEHLRFGPMMMYCNYSGPTNFLDKVVTRGGQARRVTICSGCHKEVISDENVKGSYSSRKPHVSGNMYTVHPEIIYYPVKGTTNCVFPVNLNKPIDDSTRTIVSECLAISKRVAG